MSYTDGSRGRRTKAIMLAGPIFVFSTPIALWQTQPDVALPLSGDWRMIVALVPLLLMATIVGALIASVPVMVGCAAMTALGRVNVGCRLPVVWALIGAGTAGSPAPIFGWQDQWPALALMLTGAGCALICWRGVVWDDDVPLSEAWDPAIRTCHDT